jgi:hypothetical protein
LPAQLGHAGVLAVVHPVLDLPRSDIANELGELERVAGARLASFSHAGFLPPSSDCFEVPLGRVRSTGSLLTGAGASATVSLSLVFPRPGTHLQSRLHKHRCSVNTAEPPAGRG